MGATWRVGLARQGQINKEGPGGGKAWRVAVVGGGRDESGPTGGQAGGLSPALSALFNVPWLECVGGGAREAGAHLSQALEEGAGAATRRGFLRGVGGMWLQGVTERKSLTRARSAPLKHYLSSAYPGRQA